MVGKKLDVLQFTQQVPSLSSHGVSRNVDAGWFGSCKKGVYVSAHADYTLKYANKMKPLQPEEECRIVFFRCVPGKHKQIQKKKMGMDPTSGYDSHLSSHKLEHFLFNADQLCPTHVLTVKAQENTRTLADDE